MSSNQKLKNALNANAVFSATSGLTLVIFNSSIAEIMNIKYPLILLGIGIGLLLFAGSIVAITVKPDIQTKQVKMIIWQDWAWVAGSAVILIFNPFDLSVPGNTLIAVVAIIVATLAFIQQKRIPATA